MKARNCTRRSSRPCRAWTLAAIGLLSVVLPGLAAADPLEIERAEWRSEDRRLRVDGKGRDNRAISVRNAGDDSQIGATTVDDDEWEVRISNPSPVPCRVRVRQSDGAVVERDVRNRPANCGPVAGAQPSLSINSVSVNENAGNATFTVSISAAPTAPVTVNFATANGTAAAGAGQDYTAASGTLSFPAGNNAARTITVPILNDAIDEPNETFTVTLSGVSAGAVIAAATGTGTIQDDDPAPTGASLSINSVSVNENAGNATFTVSISAAPAAPVTVNFATANGTATAGAGQDYTAASGTLTFPTGSNAARTITVPILNDTADEPNETFTVTLSGVSAGAVIAAASGTGTIQDDDPPAANIPNVSINSTAQTCGGAGQPACGTNPVAEQPAPGTGGAGNTTFKVFAVNDLGMHCGDLDTRVASILPPFNVLRAQIFQQPATGQAPVRNPAGMTVSYSATSNPNDPALAVTPTRVPNSNGVYKTNFWSIARQAYDPFYPPNILPAFYPLTANILDLGLPMPDVEQLYLGDGALTANQQRMPGILAPYATTAGGNAPQNFALLVGTQPFFTNPAFQFGYTSNVNWYTAEGIPITTFDDFGRENAYPLLRVQARNSAGTIVATTDTVVPVSSEADCQSCHADPADVQNSRTSAPTNALRTAGRPVAVSINDPQFGNVPTAASVEWASDTNILRLHDLKHGTNLIGSQPVVCQTCHYTPALDLAQVGPNDVNGRQQSNNQSMSRVIHGHHAQFTTLFPPMPAPIQTSTGAITNQAQRLQVLDQTCYSCHPGQRTKCLRGAMSNGGMLCQDCHGDMAHVGNDFSRNQPNGGFILAGDFYTNVNTPRVPWANEPGCGSCHTGDARNNLFTANGTVNTSTRGTVTVNTGDIQGNTDGIRLRQSFLSGDANKKPIVPTNKRFAENVITPGATTAPGSNPKLYRVSVDNHGAANGGGSGIFCEACHGATHAEWPNANPNANDNVTANQLQGHTGVIAECSTCHGTSLNNYNGLDGPHGLHVIGGNASTSPPFASSNLHRTLGSNYTANCASCHGGTSRGTSQGTVLSRTFADRRINGQTVPKGTPIGCTRCH